MFKFRFFLLIGLLVILFPQVNAQCAFMLGRTEYNAPNCFKCENGVWSDAECQCIYGPYGVIHGDGDSNDFLKRQCDGNPDIDDDGVPNELDQCHDPPPFIGGTLVRETVGADGCSCSQKTCENSLCSTGSCIMETGECEFTFIDDEVCVLWPEECEGEHCSDPDYNPCPSGLRRPVVDSYVCGTYGFQNNRCEFTTLPKAHWCACATINSTLSCEDDLLYQECVCDKGDFIIKGCDENWQCVWSDCNEQGYSYSTCTDANECGTQFHRPPYSLMCNYNTQPIEECYKLLPKDCDGRWVLLGGSCYWQCDGEALPQCTSTDITNCPLPGCEYLATTCVNNRCAVVCMNPDMCGEGFDFGVCMEPETCEEGWVYENGKWICGSGPILPSCSGIVDCYGMNHGPPFGCASAQWMCNSGKCVAYYPDICQCPAALTPEGQELCDARGGNCPTGLRRRTIGGEVRCVDYINYDTGYYDENGCFFNFVDECECMNIGNDPCSKDPIKQRCNHESCSNCQTIIHRPGGYNSAFCEELSPDTFCEYKIVEPIKCYEYELENEKQGSFECADDQIFQQVSFTCRDCESSYMRDEYNGEVCSIYSPESHCVPRITNPCHCQLVDGSMVCDDDLLWTMCSGECEATSCPAGYHRTYFNSDTCGRYFLEGGICVFHQTDKIYCLGIQGTDSCADDPIKQTMPECGSICTTLFVRPYPNANSCLENSAATGCKWASTGLINCLGIGGSNTCDEDPIYNVYSGNCPHIFDEDNDGVDDMFDLCPHTPLGEAVDKDGCSCSQKTCTDSNPCTVDWCNPQTGNCQFIIDDSRTCGQWRTCPESQCNPNYPYYQWHVYPPSSQDYCLNGVCVTYLCNMIDSYYTVNCDPAYIDPPLPECGPHNSHDPPLCSLQMGVCSGSRKQCVGGKWQDCTAADYGPNYGAEICDGLDNNCDGTVDPGCECISGTTKECGTDIGECRKGIQRCMNGAWESCEGGVWPAREICDGRDNDCNGLIDDYNGGPIEEPCRIQSCEGVSQCIGGVMSQCLLFDDPDNDGLCSRIDNCPFVYNPDQLDSDGDGIGDACDPCPFDYFNDIDGDGICGDVDNCPTVYNPDQLDSDGDGIGDACDKCPFDPYNDIDGDGICGDVDNCPFKYNPDQNDCDGDGIGDACDPDSPCSFDTDGDGIPDYLDNCPLVYNPLQEDTDRDGIGDACDPCPFDPFNDIDGDGICGDVDNCPFVYNPDQHDSDGDGIGDVCDICPFDPYNDIDGDGICGDVDNCPFKYNPDQNDCDKDGTGDACDLNSPCSIDSDGDGIPDYIDNCPNHYNPDQLDSDGDGIGDACDRCPFDPFNDIDKDGICGDVDNCPHIWNPDQKDSDGDGIGDVCDKCPFDPFNDIDGDGICGDVDNCPFKHNPSQADCDGNGIGDACDFNSVCVTDTDGDGIPDYLDNCPEVYNPDQLDRDGDGIGDACDPCPNDPFNDIDQDGVCGDVDNCPTIWNQNQLDSDGDGIGDACDRCPFDPENDIDGDGVCGDVDNCRYRYNPDQRDCNNDGIGDACDSTASCVGDIDGDGIPDYLDNCVDIYNPDQLDSDGDGIGDACDRCPFDPYNDIDQDGVCGNVDNCPTVYNPDQRDSDGDGIGDACDLCPYDPLNDIDEDSICGDVDNCPFLKNPGQEPCEDVVIVKEPFDKIIFAHKENPSMLIGKGAIKTNATPDELDKNFNELKKGIIIESKEYLLGGKTFTRYRITIKSDKQRLNFAYFQNIPKCVALKASNIYFNGKNYNVIEKDPVIAWQFAFVPNEFEITYDIEGSITDSCIEELREFAYASIMQRQRNPANVILPLLFIPVIIFAVILLQKRLPR
jgi:hypothetical protein